MHTTYKHMQILFEVHEHLTFYQTMLQTP